MTLELHEACDAQFITTVGQRVRGSNCGRSSTRELKAGRAKNEAVAMDDPHSLDDFLACVRCSVIQT